MALGLCVTSLGALADYSSGLQLNETLTHDSQLRYYDVYVPDSYDGSLAYPLVVDIHGLGSNKTAQRLTSGMRPLSELENFIVAYPHGLYGLPNAPEERNPVTGFPLEGPSFNAGGVCCGAAEENGTDDIGFVRAMVEAIDAASHIDTTRVYVTGLSNGGFMSHRLACETPDIFAAAVPFAASTLQNLNIDCAQQPIPILTFQGLTDSLVPYDGNIIYKSAHESLEAWKQYNGCTSPTPDVTETISDTAFCETYNSCSDNADTGLCSVTGSDAAGHFLYQNDDGIDLAEKAWHFMQQHQMLSENPINVSVPIVHVWTLCSLIIFSIIFCKANNRRVKKARGFNPYHASVYRNRQQQEKP